MTFEQEQKLDRILVLVESIHRIATKQMGGGLVGDGKVHPDAPTDAAENPGKYYGTAFDPLTGMVTSTQVIREFSPPIDDGEGVPIWKFVGGTYYQWAKADLSGFMKFYKKTYGVPLVISRLHPEQRKLMGLP